MLGALLLLVAPGIWGTFLAAAGQPMGSQTCKYECVKFTTKIPLTYLQSYERTNCGKSAVRLTTNKNRTYCANPDEQWVLNVMRELDTKNAPPSSTVDPSVLKQPGHFDKLLGSAVPMSTQTGHLAYPIETSSTAAYGMSTSSVTRTEDPEPSAVSSTLAGPQAAKPSTGSSSKPEVVVSRTTIQPEPLANRSMASYFTDGPKSFGEGLAPAGKGLEDISGLASDLVVLPTSLGTKATEAVVDEDNKASATQSTLHPSSTVINLLKKNSTSNRGLLPSSDQQGSTIKQVTENPTVGLFTVPQRRDLTSLTGAHTGTDGSKIHSVKNNKSDIVSAHGEATEARLSTQANRDAFSKSSGTLSHSVLHEEHFKEKSRGEATTPPPEVPLTFLPSALVWSRSHIISMVFLGLAFSISLAIMGLCVKNYICTNASPTEMVQGLTFSHYKTNAYAMQVL